jgi:copper chaperone CopZ
VKIQLLHFSGCPNVDATRAAVRDALAAEQLDITVEEIDVNAPDAPSWARGWGSPTVLVDGQDVLGAGANNASACRLYEGGAPSVDAIRGHLRAARIVEAGPPVAMPMVGAVAAAIAASACCLVPAVLAVVGVSGVGFAASLAPYRVYFLVATGVALAAGFWFAYRPQKDACGCEAPRSRRAARVGLWIAAVVSVAAAAYPLVVGGNATAGSGGVARATLHLRVSGMDCKPCAKTIAARLDEVPGVVSATVDYDKAAANDGRDGLASAAIAAVSDLGFRAEIQR